MPYKDPERRAEYMRQYRANRKARKPEASGTEAASPDAGGSVNPAAEGINPLVPRPMLGMTRKERWEETRRRKALRGEAVTAWLAAERAWKEEQARLAREPEMARLRERIRKSRETLRPLQEAVRAREAAEEAALEERFQRRLASLPERQKRLEARIRAAQHGRRTQGRT